MASVVNTALLRKGNDVSVTQSLRFNNNRLIPRELLDSTQKEQSCPFLTIRTKLYKF